MDLAFMVVIGAWVQITPDGSENTTALDHPHKDDDDGYNQQDMNESAQRGTGHQTEGPQDEQDDGDRH
jgi:hypothetical protein